MALGSLQYVMTLQGPRLRRAPVGLLGVFDPVVANPWWFALGIGLGIYLGGRRH